MQSSNLMEKLLWQMTGEELIHLIQNTKNEQRQDLEEININKKEAAKKYVYGLQGIADLFGCSISTANRLKKEGKITKAIMQRGRKIIVDADLALELFSKK